MAVKRVVKTDFRARASIRGNRAGSPVIHKNKPRPGYPRMAKTAKGERRKPLIILQDDGQFNDVMKQVARENPKVRKKMAVIATMVMEEVERAARKHYLTGNYQRHLTYTGPDKAGGFRIDATDEAAWHIEFGHFVKDEKTGVAEFKKKPSSALQKSKQVEGSRAEPHLTKQERKTVRQKRQGQREASANGWGPDNGQLVDGRIWVEGLHIMRNAARRVQAQIEAPRPGRLRLE